MKTGSSESLVGWISGKTTYVPLRDQMEGAWLWTQMFLLSTTKKKKKITGVDEDVICLIMGLCIWILYNIFMELNPCFVSGSLVELPGKCARPTRAAFQFIVTAVNILSLPAEENWLESVPDPPGQLSNLL
jgi:hypothetical protein